MAAPTFGTAAMKPNLVRRRLVQGLAASVAASPCLSAGGRSLRLLVGYPPGGATDAVARLLAQHLRTDEAGSIVVDNRAGAGGRIALDAARRAEPDGSTLVVTPDFPLTVFPHLYRKLGYDPIADFVPVSVCGWSEFALSVGPGVPRDIVDTAGFVRWCKDNPKHALYASPAPGSTPHFTGVMLARAAQVELTHVAYKGGAQAVQDLLGGQVPASINPVAEVLPHLAAGKLRVLATTGPARSRFLTDAPTLREAGYPNVVVQSWIGVLAPAGTPTAKVDAIERAVADALKRDAVKEGLAKFAISAASEPAERFAKTLRDDLQRWSAVVKASGFTVEE